MSFRTKMYRMSCHSQKAAILFSDFSGFGELCEKEMGCFFEIVLKDLMQIISKENPVVSNTWGDGMYLVFSNTDAAARCALAIRDKIRATNWKGAHISKNLKIRIVLHCARVTMVTDPVTNRDNAVGTDVNKTARLEPVVPPNEVFVTEEFKQQTNFAKSKLISFDDVGLVALAKKWGMSHIYRLRRQSEQALPSAEYIHLFPHHR